MPYERPALATLIARAEADIAGRVADGAKSVSRSVLRVLARVLAGLVHGLYGFLAWIFKQLFIDSAEGEFLARWASIWGISRKAAEFASGTAIVTGTPGAILPAQTVLQRADGAQFLTRAEVALAGASAAVPVEALSAGDAGNTESGIALNLVSPVAGIETALMVGGEGLVGGADVEADTSLRARLLARIQRPPQGGCEADYETWALEVPGVTRAWVRVVEDEPGHKRVIVYIVMDGKADTPIPDPAETAIAAAHIDVRRPVTAEATTTGPEPLVIAPQIRLTPATAAVKAAVEAEWRDLVLREAAPGDGVAKGAILLSHIREAISIATGETDHELLFPTETLIPALGQMVVAAAPVWVE